MLRIDKHLAALFGTIGDGFKDALYYVLCVFCLELRSIVLSLQSHEFKRIAFTVCTLINYEYTISFHSVAGFCTRNRM